MAILMLVSQSACAPARADTSSGRTGISEALFDYEAFHQNPELGKKEIETAKRVKQRLEALGFVHFESIAGLPTAVIAVLDTGKPGPTIALRAELDARPGDESTSLPYASKVHGVMHSCGHDAHTAILLGAARVLQARRTALRGRVVFIFQPAEEVAGGADDIVSDGVLDRLGVRAVFALHSAPGLPVGVIQLSPGPILAGSNYFIAKITGAGSHAAAPFEGDDVIVATARSVERLVELPARKLDLLEHPTVISVTSITAGDVKASNVLPTQAEFRGTVRSFDDVDKTVVTAAGATLRQLIENQLSAWAAAQHVSASIELRKGSPPTVNDAALFSIMIASIREKWGASALSNQLRGMFSEDFSYYTAGRPSLYASLGIAKDGLGTEPVHTNKFSVHPDALEVGIRWMSLITEVALAKIDSIKESPEKARER